MVQQVCLDDETIDQIATGVKTSTHMQYSRSII